MVISIMKKITTSSIFAFLFIFCCVSSGVAKNIKVDLRATPETEKMEKLVGVMTIGNGKLTFSNIKGSLQVKRLADIQAPVKDSDRTPFHVYKIDNFSEYMKNKPADFFCNRPAQYLLIRDLSVDSIRVIFLSNDINSFLKDPYAATCSAVTFDLN